MTPRRRDKETTRELLLETAFEMMLEQGLDVGWGVRVADVTKRVGLTTGAAYQIWSGSRTREGLGGQDKFHRDLALYTLDRLISDPSVVHTKSLEEQVDQDASFESMIRTATARDFELQSRPAEFALYLGLWAASTAMPEIAEAGRESYRQITDDYVELYSQLLDRFDLEMVPPLTVEEVVTMAIALGEGLSLRALIDPHPTRHEPPADVPEDAQGPWPLYSLAVLALVRGTTRKRAR